MEQFRRWGGQEQQQVAAERVYNKQQGPHTNIFQSRNSTP